MGQITEAMKKSVTATKDLLATPPKPPQTLETRAKPLRNNEQPS